jgi:hypothetical protein
MRDADDRPIGRANAGVSREPRSVPWIWEGVVAEGAVTLLSAPEKVGKTTLLSLLLDRRRAGGELSASVAREWLEPAPEPPEHARRVPQDEAPAPALIIERLQPRQQVTPQHAVKLRELGWHVDAAHLNLLEGGESGSGKVQPYPEEGYSSRGQWRHQPHAPARLRVEMPDDSGD